MAAQRRKKRAYIQHSKRFGWAALLIGIAAFVLVQLQIGSEPDGQVKAFIGLLEYTFGVLALYNGNSVSEKFFASKYHLFAKEQDANEDEING